MLGQSVAARVLTKSVLGAMGADPMTQAVASRVVGWATAHATFDHHNQAMAEIGDAAHDSYNLVEAVGDSGDYSVLDNNDISYDSDLYSDTSHYDSHHTTFQRQGVFEHYESHAVGDPTVPFDVNERVEFTHDYSDDLGAHVHTGNHGHVDQVYLDTTGDPYAHVHLEPGSNANGIFIDVPNDSNHLRSDPKIVVDSVFQSF